MRRLAAGDQWQFKTGGRELALVVLGGLLDVRSNRGDWQEIGRRPSVFTVFLMRSTCRRTPPRRRAQSPRASLLSLRPPPPPTFHPGW